MVYKERRRKKRIKKVIFLGIIVWLVYLYLFAPIHEAPGIDKTSEWYVNDLYMSNQYYYKNLLNKEEKEIYKKIFDSYNNMEEEIVINKSYEVIIKVWDAFICDHPEMINITSLRFQNNGDSVIIKPVYLTKSEFSLNLKVRKMQRKIKKIVKEVEGKSEFEKEKYIYEWLGEKSNYGSGMFNSDQSAYTAFTMMSNTVCAGYGKAAQILLNNCGIESMININDNHIWNTVKLDGEYYFFDATVTSNEGENITGNVSYMGLNSNKYTSDYKILYPEILPNISGKKYNYYDYYKLTLTYKGSSTLEEIKRRLQETEYSRVEFKFTNPTEANNEINKNKEYLGIRNVYTYEGYCKNNGVLLLVKK